MTQTTSQPTRDAILEDASRMAIVRRQRWEDLLFHGVTKFFAATVLLALLGIIVSLFVRAWPALEGFGFGFFTKVEWDIVNDDFGALIAIYGTVISANDRALDRGTAQFWYRLVSHGNLPRVVASSAGYLCGTARGRPLDHLRHVWPVHFCAAVCRIWPTLVV